MSLTRRGVLRAGVATVALPWLEIFVGKHARACDDGFPSRFGLFFWANGNLPDRWTPTGDGADWELSEQLAPLAPVKDVISVVSGLAVKLPNDVPHTSGCAGILSAAPLIGVGDDSTFSAPSLDQVIAAAIGGDTIYRSIQTAGSDCSGQSWNGPSSRNPPVTDPWTLYTRLFGETFRAPGEEGLVDPTLALRRSALDAVMGDIGALRARLGAADTIRLDQHLTGVRELELRLARLEQDPPSLEGCARPSEPLASYPDEDGRPQISARSRAMCDMLAMALACDQTRVFGHYMGDPVGNLLWPGASAGHHSLTHDEAAPQDEVNAITVQVMEELGYLVQALRAVPEGDATLLDHCVVMATTEVSEGRTHSLSEMPVVLAGGACGRLRMGQHVRSYTQDNASKLLLTLVRAMDMPLESFGVDEAESTDGLSDIET